MRETGNIFQILIGNRGVIQIKLTQISKFFQQGELRVFQGHSAKILLHYRLEERRVGNEFVSTFRSRWSTYHLIKQKTVRASRREIVYISLDVIQLKTH